VKKVRADAAEAERAAGHRALEGPPRGRVSLEVGQDLRRGPGFPPVPDEVRRRRRRQRGRQDVENEHITLTRCLGDQNPKIVSNRGLFCDPSFDRDFIKILEKVEEVGIEVLVEVEVEVEVVGVGRD